MTTTNVGVAAAEVDAPTTDPIAEQVVSRLASVAGEGISVILFGSRSRGTHRPDSDIDLLVEMPAGLPVFVQETIERDVLREIARLQLPVRVDAYQVLAWESPTKLRVYALGVGRFGRIFLDLPCEEESDDHSDVCGDCHFCGQHARELLTVHLQNGHLWGCGPCMKTWRQLGMPSTVFGDVLDAVRRERAVSHQETVPRRVSSDLLYGE